MVTTTPPDGPRVYRPLDVPRSRRSKIKRAARNSPHTWPAPGGSVRCGQEWFCEEHTGLTRLAQGRRDLVRPSERDPILELSSQAGEGGIPVDARENTRNDESWHQHAQAVGRCSPSSVSDSLSRATWERRGLSEGNDLDSIDDVGAEYRCHGGRQSAGRSDPHDAARG